MWTALTTLSNKSSPRNVQESAICKSPTGHVHHADNFVRQSGDNTDDPFVAKAQQTLTESCGQLCYPLTSQGIDILGGPSSSYRVREDRVGESPTASTAQAHFGPEACIFIAKYAYHFY